MGACDNEGVISCGAAISPFTRALFAPHLYRLARHRAGITTAIAYGAAFAYLLQPGARRLPQTCYRTHGPYAAAWDGWWAAWAGGGPVHALVKQRQRLNV